MEVDHAGGQPQLREIHINKLWPHAVHVIECPLIPQGCTWTEEEGSESNDQHGVQAANGFLTGTASSILDFQLSGSISCNL